MLDFSLHLYKESIQSSFYQNQNNNAEVYIKLCRLIGQPVPLSTTLEESLQTAKKPNNFVRDLFDEPEVFSTIKTGYKNLGSVACLNREQIQTSGETDDIKRFNIQRGLQKLIKLKSGTGPINIAVGRD